MSSRSNWEREQITRAHSNNLRQLNGLYLRSLDNLFLGIAKGGTDGLIGAFTANLPSASRPFQLSAAQLAFQFHNIRREAAAQNFGKTAPPNRLTLGSFNLDNIVKQAVGGNLAEIGFTIYKGLQDGRDAKQIAPGVRMVAGKFVTDVDREVIKAAVEADEFAEEAVVAVSPDGCNYCKSLTIDWGEDFEAEFHENCSCVLDSSFKGEPKFQQSFSEDYSKQVEEAKALISQGGAGERTIQAGSAEWNKATEKQLAAAARNFRKDFEARNNLTSPEDKAAQRTIMDRRTEKMTTKATLVAKGKDSWTEQDKKQLQSWGVDSEELMKPRTKKIDSMTQKNVVLALEIVQGNRQVKQ